MLPEIARRFGPDVRDASAQLAGLDPAALESLGGFEAHVFRAGGTILKITHTLRRTAEALAGEAEFVEHLADAGVPVARPLPMADGARVGRLPDGEGGTFLVCASQALDGRETGPDDWDEPVIGAWGHVAGAMVRASGGFQPSRPARRRRHWADDPIVDFARSIPADAPGVRARAISLHRSMAARPQTPATEGLVHADLHHRNWLLDEAGRVRPFDFDDCEVSPFVCEVGVPLYYAVAAVGKTASDAARRDFAGGFVRTFLRAFLAQHPLSRAELETLPDWLAMRSFILFAALHETTATGDLTAAERDAALARVRARLDAGPAWTGIDFSALARELGR